jgi:hypothetical protein
MKEGLMFLLLARKGIPKSQDPYHKTFKFITDNIERCDDKHGCNWCKEREDCLDIFDKQCAKYNRSDIYQRKCE